LAHAFADEPLTVYMLPDPTKRARHLHGHFERVPALGLATGEVWCSPRLDAVACWIAPGRWPTTDAEMAASGLDRSEEVTDGRHGDLWVIGVEPDRKARASAAHSSSPSCSEPIRAAIPAISKPSTSGSVSRCT